MTRFVVVIPARYASTRLPAKALADIAGKPMIQHVYERARESGAERVLIATDDARIEQAAKTFGAEVCMTDSGHQSGTDRLAEVVAREGFADDAIVVNVQGDEPLMPPALIDQVADNLAAHPDASAATLCIPIASSEETFDPNAVKVVMDQNGYALYFSRATIPWDRDNFKLGQPADYQPQLHYRHLGIYAYRCKFLHQFVRWQPAAIERLEALEQLRILYQGHRIHVAQAQQVPPPGVDTAHDLQRVRQHFANIGSEGR